MVHVSNTGIINGIMTFTLQEIINLRGRHAMFSFTQRAVNSS